MCDRIIFFLSFIFILSFLVEQNTINATIAPYRIFFKIVIKMSVKYGETERKTRDRDFKMKKKFQKKK